MSALPPEADMLCVQLHPPEILEASRCQLGIADSVLDVFMPKVGLERPRVVAVIGERIATGVSQHVWVRFEPELGADTRPLDHPGKASGSERCASL